MLTATWTVESIGHTASILTDFVPLDLQRSREIGLKVGGKERKIVSGIYRSFLMMWALGRVPLACSMAASRAPVRPNWVLMPSTRWVELMFLTRVSCQQVAPPWREVMVEEARKYSQIYGTKSVTGKS
jgi:hypothetical protein